MVWFISLAFDKLLVWERRVHALICVINDVKIVPTATLWGAVCRLTVDRILESSTL